MISPFALWLPVLVSAVLVLVISSVLHMVIPWYRSDYPPLPNEPAVSDALASFSIAPGEYIVPMPASGSAKSPESEARMKRGPSYILRMMPPESKGMAAYMGQWFAYMLVVGAIAGLVAWPVVGENTGGHTIFHTVALSSFMGYCLALWQMAIWYRRSWSATIKGTIDGLIYGVVTGVVFVWLWPR